jgi:hypothetical protein
MTIKDINWFLEKIGTRIFRDDDGCDCPVCKTVVRNGLIIHDELHAKYLYDCQNELKINYYERKKDVEI